MPKRKESQGTGQQMVARKSLSGHLLQHILKTCGERVPDNPGYTIILQQDSPIIVKVHVCP